MKYNFSYKLNHIDIFNSSLNYMKHSKTFIFDIIFTIVVFIVIVYMILIGKFMQMTNINKFLLFLAFLIFPVIQPLFIYIKSINQEKKLNNKTINLLFDDNKMCLNIDNQTTEVLYKDIYNVVNYKNMIVIFFDAIQGLIMPERIFNEKKDDFYNSIMYIINIKKNEKNIN